MNKESFEKLKEKKEKLIKTNSQNNDFKKGFEDGVDKSFFLFKSYVKFYKDYRGDIKKLHNEQKKVWNKWASFYKDKTDIDKDNYIRIYNKWLFDYIFEEVEFISEKSILF